MLLMHSFSFFVQCLHSDVATVMWFGSCYFSWGIVYGYCVSLSLDHKCWIHNSLGITQTEEAAPSSSHKESDCLGYLRTDAKMLIMQAHCTLERGRNCELQEHKWHWSNLTVYISKNNSRNTHTPLMVLHNHLPLLMFEHYRQWQPPSWIKKMLTLWK